MHQTQKHGRFVEINENCGLTKIILAHFPTIHYNFPRTKTFTVAFFVCFQHFSKICSGNYLHYKMEKNMLDWGPFFLDTLLIT